MEEQNLNTNELSDEEVKHLIYYGCTADRHNYKIVLDEEPLKIDYAFDFMFQTMIPSQRVWVEELFWKRIKALAHYNKKQFKKNKKKRGSEK